MKGTFPNDASPASINRAKVAPVSMVSIPRSLATAFRRAMSSGSSIPQFVPSKPMVSYSRGETISLPSRSA